MTEAWKSTAKHYCKICNVWLADRKASIRNHEEGKKHKENAELHFNYLAKTKQNAASKDKALQDQLAAIERAAQASFQKDVESGIARGGGSSYAQPPPPPPPSNVLPQHGKRAAPPPPPPPPLHTGNPGSQWSAHHQATPVYGQHAYGGVPPPSHAPTPPAAPMMPAAQHQPPAPPQSSSSSAPAPHPTSTGKSAVHPSDGSFLERALAKLENKTKADGNTVAGEQPPLKKQRNADTKAHGEAQGEREASHEQSELDEHAVEASVQEEEESDSDDAIFGGWTAVAPEDAILTKAARSATPSPEASGAYEEEEDTIRAASDAAQDYGYSFSGIGSSAPAATTEAPSSGGSFGSIVFKKKKKRKRMGL